ncbi:MAG: DUF4238 domain-containing protein, partial [Clostridia bacterium]|nr:DUF4238 domain-containing protein [Clostridia bacterium]
GSLVSKKRLKAEIEKIKIKDIETNWSTKYENNWGLEVAKIEENVLCTPYGSIPAFDKDYLTKFFTALDWRGFNSNQHFEEMYSNLTNDLLDNIEIPEGERILPALKTAADEMRHYLLLKFYRQYLNDTGVIFKDAMASLQYTSFHFLVADGPTKFITSDSTAFIHKREDEKLIGLLPITPRLLMMKGKCTEDDGLYYVTHITDEAVNGYNNAIRTNAEEFIIC